MRVYNRNGRPYLDIGTHNGKRERFSVAKYLKGVSRASLRSPGVQNPVSLDAAISQYLQEVSYGISNRWGRPKSRNQAETDQRVLERLLSFTGPTDVHLITEAHINRFMNLQATRICPNTRRLPSRATLNRWTAVLTSFGHFLERAKGVEVSPARGLKQKREDNLRTSWVASEVELRAWRDTLSGTPRSVFDVLVRTGMRLSECLNLRSADYDRGAKVFYLHNTKGNRMRQVPASPYVQSVVEPRLGREWLFACERTGVPYKAAGIHSIFYRARDKAGLRKLTVHDLRRTAASHMLKKNVSVRVIQELLGHRSLDTTMRYLGVDSGQTREAVAVLDNLGLPEEAAQSRTPEVVTAQLCVT